MNQFYNFFDEKDPIGSVFASLIGLPAWGVQKGHGSMLTFEFGTPSLSIREPIANPQTDNPEIREFLRRRHVAIHGEWYLWIGICHWRCIGNSIEQSTDQSPEPQIVESANFLNGQKLVSIDVDVGTGKTRLKFDLGGVLETWPYGDDGKDEQWSLYAPTRYVLTLRADGLYSWTPCEQEPNLEVWLPLPEKGK